METKSVCKRRSEVCKIYALLCPEKALLESRTEQFNLCSCWILNFGFLHAIALFFVILCLALPIRGGTVAAVALGGLGLLSDQACEIRCCLLGFLDSGLRFSWRLADGRADYAT